MAAASPFSGSIGLGYVNNCGRNDSNIFERSEKDFFIETSKFIDDLEINIELHWFV